MATDHPPPLIRRGGNGVSAAPWRRVVCAPRLLRFRVAHRPQLPWIVSAALVAVLVAGLWGLLRDVGPLVAETVAIQPVSASGPDLFFYIVATNTATLAWCLLGWLTFGVGSLIAGSVAIAAVVVSIETGIEVMGSASLLALGVHAGLELLACALATTAGLFPAVCVLLRPSSGSKGGAPVRAYFARIVSAAPLAAAAVAIVFVGALWETVVAVRLV